MPRCTHLTLTAALLFLCSGCGEKPSKPAAVAQEGARSAASTETPGKDAGAKEAPAPAEPKKEEPAKEPEAKKEPPPDVAKLDLLPVQVHFEQVIPAGYFDAARLGVDQDGLKALFLLLRHAENKREDAVAAVERMRYITWAYVADRSHKQLKDVYKPILEAHAKGDAKEFSRLANAVNAWRLWRRSINDLMLNEKKPAEAPELKAMNDLLERVRTAKDVAAQKEPIAELQKQHSAYAKKIGLVK